MSGARLGLGGRHRPPAPDLPLADRRRRAFQPGAAARRRTVLERADLSIATGYFVRGLTSRDMTIAFDDGTAGYLWSFPRPDHVAVGICAQADESTSPALLEAARAWIARGLPTGGALQRYAWPIPSLSEAALARERPSGPGWMLRGTPPASSIRSRARASTSRCARRISRPTASCRSAIQRACYAESIRDDIHDELRRAARLKARFFRPAFIGLLMRALQSSAPIRAVMADLVAGEQTYRGLRRRLLGTYELRLMVEMITGIVKRFEGSAGSMGSRLAGWSRVRGFRVRARSASACAK